MTNQESTLSKSIYQNMLLKDSDELLAIWIKNDRFEWSDEAFSVVHDILLERLGNVPPQNTGKPPKRKRNKEPKERPKMPSPVILIFLPAVIVLLMIALIPIIDPGPDDQWFTVLFFVSMTLFFFTPGFYFGWKSLFQSEQVKQRISDNLPRMKKSWGIVYRIYTFFLPDRVVPIYFLIVMMYMSVMLIYGGVRMILFLLEVL